MEKKEQEKLYNAIEGLEMVLHPTIFDNLTMQVTRALNECREEKMSKEYQQIEPLLQQFKFSKNSPKEVRKMHLRHLTEKIEELF